MRSLLVLFVFCLGVSSARATTLVALWSPERILLGADSLVVTDSPGVTDGGCKIAREGGTYFAVSGLVNDPASGFSAGRVVHDALKGPEAIDVKLKRFIASAEPSLVKAVAALKQDAPGDYKYLLSGKPILQVIFAAPGAKHPVLAMAGFHIDPAGGVRSSASLIDGSDALGPRIIYAGQQGRIRTYLRSHPEWPQADSQTLVRDLVQLEVDANSGWVGGPVDVLELGGAGAAQWIQVKPGCGE